jgi:hypothetical protein
MRVDPGDVTVLADGRVVPAASDGVRADDGSGWEPLMVDVPVSSLDLPGDVVIEVRPADDSSHAFVPIHAVALG